MSLFYSPRTKFSWLKDESSKSEVDSSLLLLSPLFFIELQNKGTRIFQLQYDFLEETQ